MIQYKQVVIWDINVIDVGFLGSEQSVPLALRGLACDGTYIVTGAPAATAGQWMPGAMVKNSVDGTVYINKGTTASPVWTIIDTAAGLALTHNHIFVGNSSNLPADVAMSGDATIADTGAVTLADTVKLYSTKVTLSSAQILALNGTPIQLLAAPGSGKIYELMSVSGRMNFLTAAYATHTALDITDATTGDILFSDTGTLLAATSTKVATVIPNANSGAGVVKTSNGAINAAVATGNPATGAGTLDLYLTYKIITL